MTKPKINLSIHCLDGITIRHVDIDDKDPHPFTVAYIGESLTGPCILLPFGTRLIVQQTANVEDPA